MDVPTEAYTTVPLFEGLKPLEIMELLKIAEDVDAEPGDVVVQEGAPGDGFYVVGAGRFDVMKEGIEEPLAHLDTMSFFGEMSLVTHSARSATVVCTEAGRLKRFPIDQFDALLEAGDVVAYKVIHRMSRILAHRLARVQNRLAREMAALTLTE
jgi:CRP-like cAMP-binding protein